MELLKLQAFKNKRILVTGAGGFIGRHLLRALDTCGAVISTFDKTPAGLTVSGREYVGDLLDAGFVEACIESSKPEIIFHLAAFKERTVAIEAFSKAVQTNLMGSLNLFTAAQRLTGPDSIVVVGTAEEYGQNTCPFTEDMREAPVSAYSFSKLCLTQLCQVLHTIYRMPFVVVRPTLAYGPGQGSDMFLPALIEALLHNRPFAMTPGRQTRDFIYVTDLVEALIRFSQPGIPDGQVYNVGSGQPVMIADLALEVEKMLGKSGLVRLGSIDYRPGEIMDYFVDNRKVRDLLGWQPETSLAEGLAKTLEYCLRGD